MAFEPATQQIITAVTLLFMVLALFRNWFKPIVVFGFAIVTLLVTNIINTQDALFGFANENVAIIILLLIISSIVKKAGLIEHGLNTFFKGANSYKRFSFRLVGFVSLISGLLNNTPIVAGFIPYVFSWGKKQNISPSKLLLPLSYAAILGGTLTLIGTSTNLIVNGLAIEMGFEGFSLFDFTFIGLPLVVFGGLYILFFGNKMLPNRADALTDFESQNRDYLVEALVMDNSVMVDKTVEQADLRSLKGLFLVEIIRGDRKIGPVKPTQNIRQGDHLIFAGDTSTIPELLNSGLGLELPKLRDIPKQERIKVVEAVISTNSELKGKQVRQTNFRGKYDAAIVGIHRNGSKLEGKIGDVILESGDLLVLMTGKDFEKRMDNGNFYVLSNITEIDNLDKPKAWGISLGALLAIALSAVGVISLFKALLIFIVVCIVFNWVKAGEIQRSLDLNLAIIAALSIGIGQAMVKSGLANELANFITHVQPAFGAVGVLVAVYLVTNLLTEFITNVAAASIVLPITMSVSQQSGLPVEPFIMAVAFAASASFLTPIGYQTNLMVYGPGSYQFKDYFKFGLPLTIICLVVVIGILSIKYQLFGA